MRMFIVVLCLLGAALPLAAQQQTLIGGELSSGGYGAPMVQFSNIKGDPAVLVGGKGGWIINKTLVLGLGGYGKVTTAEVDSVPGLFGKSRQFDFGYGGIILGYVHKSDDLVHWTADLLIGAGAVTLRSWEPYNYDWRYSDDERTSKAFFVIEPTVAVELNIAPYCRINLGAGYRHVTGVDFYGLKDSDFSSPHATLTLKFGSFD